MLFSVFLTFILFITFCSLHSLPSKYITSTTKHEHTCQKWDSNPLLRLHGHYDRQPLGHDFRSLVRPWKQSNLYFSNCPAVTVFHCTKNHCFQSCDITKNLTSLQLIAVMSLPPQKLARQCFIDYRESGSIEFGNNRIWRFVKIRWMVKKSWSLVS